MRVPLCFLLISACTPRHVEPGVAEEASRKLEITYRTRLTDLPSDGQRLDLFFPIPAEGVNQRNLSMAIDSSLTGEIVEDPVHGNRAWHAVAEAPFGEIWVEGRFSIQRVARAASPSLAEEATALYLEPSSRVPVGEDLAFLAPILAEIREGAGGGDKREMARAIFDWVVDHMEYKKVGTGWGNGDTFWGCTERYGNCTDFHSVFLSLARTEGIPARFHMGFPLPKGKGPTALEGYHCWVEFYLPQTGWVPIDASEAARHPEQREAYYGQGRTDRVRFSTGRDIRFGEAHRGEALNYFIYPYAEVDGVEVEGGLESEVHFRELGN